MSSKDFIKLNYFISFQRIVSFTRVVCKVISLNLQDIIPINDNMILELSPNTYCVEQINPAAVINVALSDLLHVFPEVSLY